MTIKGILFDKDGTLLDFHATWIPVNRLVAETVTSGDPDLTAVLLREGGHDPDSDHVTSGTPLAAGNSIDIAACFARHLPDWEQPALVAEIDRLFLEGAAKYAAPVPDLQVTLRRLKARNMVLGVATSDSEQGLHSTLGPLAVLEHFDFLAGYDSGHGVKPEPGMVRGFCGASGLPVESVAVVGDNLHDIEMGRNAGAGLVVGVLTGTSSRAELAPHADRVLDSIADLEALLDRV